MGSGAQISDSTNMKVLALLLVAVPALNALCLVNSCDSYWSGAQAKLKKDGACAVLFDENCCKASKDHLVVKKGEQGKLCGTGSGLNPLSSCKGSGLKDDIEALFVMPGCKLEVWDHGSGLEGAIKEERKGFNQGDYKNMRDMYDQNKLIFRADRTKPHWVRKCFCYPCSHQCLLHQSLLNGEHFSRSSFKMLSLLYECLQQC